MSLSTLSQSSLQDYSDCARRFQLRYLEQLAYPAVETEPALANEQRQREGEYFHRLVQQHLLGIPAEEVGRLASSADIQRWWEHYLNDPELQKLRQGPKLYPELTLSAPLPPYRLLAKFDLIALPSSDKAIIYDWKTYRKRPPNEALVNRWQTRVYRALLAKAGEQFNNGQPLAPEHIEMVYWFADYPQESAHFPYNAAQYKRDWDALEKLAAEISTASDFPLTENTGLCAWCSYRSYCNRGVEAGEGDEAEAETDLTLTLEQIGEIEL